MADAQPADSALTPERIRQDVAEILGEEPDEIPLDENLVDYGLDSVRLMTLRERWQRENGVEVGFAELAERPAVEEWARLLAR
ncbi:phosphopantetheine-binding protein [Streptomyces sp. XM4193]|uniref:phosphopantetheine-binding protein n=1 Tax=Streptomyces sp. XM4193 TaxID=2929782 RepID=UPI001FFAD023|nr:phosphopantetheine-binding protein [Streptomyces sp. XM4193]MCK1798050.1 phosphopantetheine-binding protein [Streptomyces sp. XM4193]